MSDEFAAVRQRLGRSGSVEYTLEREIGRGGMATVYLAHDRKHDRGVALKVLHPELAASLGADRFLREIRLLARLQHPHILPLFDSGQADGLLYFVMPFIDGQSLKTRLDAEHSLPLGEAIRILRQIADALDYAHGLGIVHRDLKPDNILLTHGQALIADFGIAHAATESVPGEALTAVGLVVGTAAYMSPEQGFGEKVDARSDVYSLGCVCYEMLSGRPPFSGPTAMSLIGQHLTAEPPPLVGARESLPESLSAAVARALAKEPEQRYATAGAFAAALERAADENRDSSEADQRLRRVESQQAMRPAVLVLDFTNVSGTVDADWLCTGIAQTVSADLRKLRELRVIGHDPLMQRRIQSVLGNRPPDDDSALDIGRATGARWVVWGSFQMAGPRIRIMPQFADVLDGIVHGGEKIDGAMDEVFELQDRVVTSLIELLQLRVSSGELERIRRPETANLTAYEHYARGYQSLLQFAKESIRVAAEHFRAAIALDPGYAPAFAGLGMIHGPMYIATGRPELIDEGIRFLQRGLELDPTLADAFAWLCYLNSRAGRHADAQTAGLRGIEVEPASYFSWYMVGSTRLVEALQTHHPELMSRAIPPLLRTLMISPRYHAAVVVLTSIYQLRGEYGHATALADFGIELERGSPGLQFIGSLAQRAALAIALGDHGVARPLLDASVLRYEGADHVYAEAVTAYAYWLRGRMYENEGDFGPAAESYARVCAIAEANPHRISIGGHWVKARFGLARARHAVGDVVESARILTDALSVFEHRATFIWTWFIATSDADVLYELAATHAYLGRDVEALSALRRAANAGWADLPWLHRDLAFVNMRDRDDVRLLCARAAARVTLPAPVGSGGLG